MLARNCIRPRTNTCPSVTGPVIPKHMQKTSTCMPSDSINLRRAINTRNSCWSHLDERMPTNANEIHSGWGTKTLTKRRSHRHEGILNPDNNRQHYATSGTVRTRKSRPTVSPSRSPRRCPPPEVDTRGCCLDKLPTMQQGEGKARRERTLWDNECSALRDSGKGYNGGILNVSDVVTATKAEVVEFCKHRK